MTLSQIEMHIRNITDSIEWLLDQSNGEVTDEICALYDDLDTFMQEDLPSKADAYLAVVEEYSDWAEICRNKARELTERARKHEEKAKRLERRLLDVMQRVDATKLQCPQHYVRVQMGPEKAVEVEANGELPDHLCHIKRTPDKTAIKIAILAGHGPAGWAVVRDPFLAYGITTKKTPQRDSLEPLSAAE